MEAWYFPLVLKKEGSVSKPHPKEEEEKVENAANADLLDRTPEVAAQLEQAEEDVKGKLSNVITLS